MITFENPRTASDIAAVVYGRQGDREILPDISEHVLRRIRARVDLIVGSKASEDAKDMVVEKVFVRVIRDPVDFDTNDPQYATMDEFEGAIRQRINRHCGYLGHLRNRPF